MASYHKVYTEQMEISIGYLTILSEPSQTKYKKQNEFLLVTTLRIKSELVSLPAIQQEMKLR